MDDDFKLPEDQERLRKSLFPNLSPREFGNLVKKRRREFEVLSPEAQSHALDVLDRMGENIKKYKAGMRED